MGILSGLEPQEPLRFFEELCAIPHGSRNTKAISDYCVAFAKDRGLEVIQDEWNNIIMIKEATAGYEEKDTIILQGHLDMVCVKVPGSDFDFEQDGLELEIVDGWITARDTTLGGDDGIAIAMALAIMDSNELSHPRIEAIFTVDEEIGLVGAQCIDLSMLEGKKLINIDSEDDTQILTSCAGGLSIQGTVPVSHNHQSGIGYTLEIKGLLGGHSGAEIHKQRGNAIVLMGRVLYGLGDTVEVASVNGGTAHNVIPRMATAEVLVSSEQESAMLERLVQVEKAIKGEYSISDGGFYIEACKHEQRDSHVLDHQSKMVTLNALMNLPYGVQAMSMAIENLVETSVNLGICNLSESELVIECSIRSSKETAKRYLGDKITALFHLLGGTVEELGAYPGWDYRVDSSLRENVVKVYTDLFGKEPVIGAIHAGLECGLFSDKIEDLDCVSIGPNLEAIHSVDERMEIASVERIWKLLVGVLAE